MSNQPTEDTQKIDVVTFMYNNRKLYLDNSHYFFSVFHTALAPFWDRFTGFDLVKFDETFIIPEDFESIHDAVLRKFGKAGVDLVEKLIGG